MSSVDRVLVPLPGERWLALTPGAFQEALAAGATLMGTPQKARGEDSEGLVDAEQLAKDLALPVTWIEQAAREDKIPSIRAGRWRRFRRSAVELVLTNGTTA